MNAIAVDTYAIASHTHMRILNAIANNIVATIGTMKSQKNMLYIRSPYHSRLRESIQEI